MAPLIRNILPHKPNRQPKDKLLFSLRNSYVWNSLGDCLLSFVCCYIKVTLRKKPRLQIGTTIVMQNDANPSTNFKAGITNVYNCFVYKPVFDYFSFAESPLPISERVWVILRIERIMKVGSDIWWRCESIARENFVLTQNKNIIFKLFSLVIFGAPWLSCCLS